MTLELRVKDLLDTYSKNQQTFYEVHTVKVDAVSAAYRNLSKKLTDLENKPAPNIQAIIDQNNVTIRQEITAAVGTRTTPAQVDTKIATAKTSIETDYNQKISAKATPSDIDTKITAARTAIQTDYDQKIAGRTTGTQVDTKISSARTSIETNFSAQLALKVNRSDIANPAITSAQITTPSAAIFPTAEAISGNVQVYAFPAKATRLALSITFPDPDTGDADDVHWLIRLNANIPAPLPGSLMQTISFNPNTLRTKTIAVYGIGSAFIADEAGTMKPGTAFFGVAEADGASPSFYCIGISTIAIASNQAGTVIPSILAAQIDYVRET